MRRPRLWLAVVLAVAVVGGLGFAWYQHMWAQLIRRRGRRGLAGRG
jgi:nitrate reductase NapE component